MDILARNAEQGSGKNPIDDRARQSARPPGTTFRTGYHAARPEFLPKTEKSR
jgi:hypothetical protein